MTSHLFQPLRLRNLELPNRIVVAPMCQYSAIDGCATDWHMIHVGHLALSGAGLLLTEATAVAPRGRISRECLGLYSDANEAALKTVLTAIRRHSAMPIGVQLNHAGRKASTRKPPDGRSPITPDEGGWPVVGPSPIAWNSGALLPTELDIAGMADIIDAFVQATQRCDRLGIDLIELHAAHGYLLSQFLSPLANQRTDNYGGTDENRMRFPLEVFHAVRAAWPQVKPLGVRLNATDWDAAGIVPDHAVAFAARLAERGCDFVDVSSGGNVLATIPAAPLYQVPFAARIKREVGMPTIAVGLIRTPEQAEAIIANGEADMVALARGMLNDPRWPWHAAEQLGASVAVPSQYARAATRDGTASPNARSAS